MRSLIFRAEKIQMEAGHPLRSPAKRDDIIFTINLVRERFKVELPDDYVEFLKFRNGFWFEGFTIYNAKFIDEANESRYLIKTNIVDENEAWRKGFEELNRDYLYFGESDMDLFALNLKTKIYEQQDRISRDVLESFPNFTSMMIPALTAYVESMENK